MWLCLIFELEEKESKNMVIKEYVGSLDTDTLAELKKKKKAELLKNKNNDNKKTAEKTSKN